ncbi:protein of unknown function [Burkholderia multivorans]
MAAVLGRSTEGPVPSDAEGSQGGDLNVLGDTALDTVTKPVRA